MARFTTKRINEYSIQILDAHDTYEDFIAEHPTGNPGDAHLVGDHIYSWNPELQQWVDAGHIVGPAGPEGLMGPTGPQGPKGDTGAIGASGTSGLETWTRYSPTFAATGLAFTGSNGTYPTYNSYYVKAGKLVSFVIEVNCSTVTNFGTGQYKLQLPFTPAVGFNHFTGWANVDTEVNPDVTDGHVVLNVDHAGVTDVLDIRYLKQSGGAKTAIIEGLFLQGTPVTLTTSSKIYVNGTYISA